MIDHRTEKILLIADVPTYVAENCGGYEPNRSTVYAWIAAGLETLAVGGRTATSVEALQRYFERNRAAARGAS